MEVGTLEEGRATVLKGGQYGFGMGERRGVSGGDLSVANRHGAFPISMIGFQIWPAEAYF